MKTELEIAKEYIYYKNCLFNSKTDKEYEIILNTSMKIHKQSCERFLEFLEDLRSKYLEDLESVTNDKEIYDYLEEIRIFNDGKIKDLQNTIKLYKENKK